MQSWILEQVSSYDVACHNLMAYVLGIAALVGSIGITQAATASVVQRLTDAASSEVRVGVRSARLFVV